MNKDLFGNSEHPGCYLNPFTDEWNYLDVNNPQPGIYMGVPQTVYLQINAVSRSLLKDFKNNKEKILFPEKKQSEALIFGTQYHAYLLEPEYFSEHFVMGTEYRRSNADKENHAKLVEQYGGEEYVYRPQNLEKMKAMKEALSRYPKTHACLTSSHPKELVTVARHPETGFMLKKKDDVTIMEAGWSLDLKSCRDPRWESFRWDVGKFGYDLQAGFYIFVNALTPGMEHVRNFGIMAQSKDPELRYMARSHDMREFVSDYMIESERLLVEYKDWCDAGRPIDDDMRQAKNYSF